MTFEVTMGELAEFRGGSAFPREEQGGSIRDLPFAKVSDLSRSLGERHLNDVREWVSNDQAARLRPTIAPSGATLFAKIGEGLKAERFRQDPVPTAIDNNMMAAVARTEVCHTDFLFYLLRFVGVAQFANGSALPYLTQKRLAEIPVSVPKLPQQQAIAEVLGALDDKIAANSRLVKVSHELLKSLHFQTLTGDATELTYAEIATVGGGGTPSTNNEQYWGGSIRWAAPSDITALDAPYLDDTPRHITESST